MYDTNETFSRLTTFEQKEEKNNATIILNKQRRRWDEGEEKKREKRNLERRKTKTLVFHENCSHLLTAHRPQPITIV